MKKQLVFLFLTVISIAVFAKQPIIIDTDLGSDDWSAIAYLMNQSSVDIQAIVIEGSGETDCAVGVPNLSKALQYWQRTDIPIACNDRPGLYKTTFPKAWRNKGRDYFKDLHVEQPKPVLVKKSPALLMNQVLEHSAQPVVILALGPLTNVFDASQLNKSLWQSKVKAIYFTGGNFTQHAMNIAKFYPETKSDPRSWNLFISPYAGHKVFQLPLSFTLNPYEPRSYLDPQYEVYRNVSTLSQQHRLNQYGEVAFAMQPSKIKSYWDDALTAVMFIDPQVCEYRWVSINVLYKSFQTSGVSMIDPNGTRVKYCAKINRQHFNTMFLQSISK